MAMAPRSLVPLLLLSVLISCAAAARTVGDSVQEACSKSQFPKECTDGLSSKPESQKATPRKLAELFVGIAAEKGSSVATFLEGKLNKDGGKDGASLSCYDSCGDDVEEAMAHLNGLTREPTDAKFLELKAWLASTLGATGACEEACKDLPDREEVVKNSFEFEKLLRVTLDLITEASGSMSAAEIALPPSDAAAPAAYGSAAPTPFGGAIAKGVEAPEGSETEGPSAAPKPASGPAAAAADSPAGADAPSSGAPAPSSGSSAADGPSSGSSPADAPSGDSSGASAPSSDDTASDDDDNDTGA